MSIEIEFYHAGCQAANDISEIDDTMEQAKRFALLMAHNGNNVSWAAGFLDTWNS